MTHRVWDGSPIAIKGAPTSITLFYDCLTRKRLCSLPHRTRLSGAVDVEFLFALSKQSDKPDVHVSTIRWCELYNSIGTI